MLNEKEGWEKEKKRLIDENSTLREQLKILRSKQFGKSSEKTKKKIEELEQKIEENGKSWTKPCVCVCVCV